MGRGENNFLYGNLDTFVEGPISISESLPASGSFTSVREYVKHCCPPGDHMSLTDSQNRFIRDNRFKDTLIRSEGEIEGSYSEALYIKTPEKKYFVNALENNLNSTTNRTSITTASNSSNPKGLSLINAFTRVFGHSREIYEDRKEGALRKPYLYEVEFEADKKEHSENSNASNKILFTLKRPNYADKNRETFEVSALAPFTVETLSEREDCSWRYNSLKHKLVLVSDNPESPEILGNVFLDFPN